MVAGARLRRTEASFQREVHRVADAGVHALPADRRVNVRGIAEQKGAAVAEVLGDAMMDAVGGEPVDALDVDVNPVEDALGDVLPGEVVAGLFGLLVAYRADEANAAVVVERKDREEVRVVERDVELAVGDRAGGLNIRDVEEVRVLSPGEADVELLPHDRARSVAARQEVTPAALFRAVGEAELRCDGAVGWK